MPEAPDLVRLRQEYAARDRRLADSERYTLANPAHSFMIRGRERAVLSMLKQKEKLFNTTMNWRGEQEQIDDILVVGIRV